ncbi:DNA helicase/exodeoxyribonuclease V subunit gamma [Canicola haemoglobinophilus]|uniref:RecBCD enzyme subunit RecC n=1 Tax=Canicola haemoglobinophilus TaxID=733 RepID=A0AB38HD89_9PAST|nr:exodeoxyribonuclease V subunit gamma [Canicola haemoglobinophilus]STO54875.1 DNA helicase/exodeoxyribonuclease V subunit gamma [Canicola haemoglobinophilus]STO69554.1 DNA helicase/exodeoxyribonuclease V subunit gamma [Canicola haemoglobinophilus]
MLTLYYSNQLETQKDILSYIIDTQPLSDPFQSEIILVQSPGMAQWLQWQLAEKKGISANIRFPMPASFIWQQYVDNLSHVSSQAQFNKESMTWRLMDIIPLHLEQPEFKPLQQYLQGHQSEQQRYYHLAYKIADLFDQYLVYRPEWIIHWEQGKDIEIKEQIKSQQKKFETSNSLFEQVEQHVTWQGILWRALVQSVQQAYQEKIYHRAHLHLQFLQKLSKEKPKNLPSRIFVFGISALPKTYLDVLKALSQYCDIHLFCTNPCGEYWGDIIDHQHWQRLRVRERILWNSTLQQDTVRTWLSNEQVQALEQNHVEHLHDEKLQVGNPLLSSWGKLGRDYLYLLTELEANEINAYVDLSEQTLLSQVQSRILNLVPSKASPLNKLENDRSLTFHSCYSPMREVQALQDYLLHLFNQDPKLTPKDIVVMVADIDKYTPYIQAVFSQGEHYIPYAISDNKLSESYILVSSFLKLLNLKESVFSAEEVLAFLDLPTIRHSFNIELEDLSQIRHWVENSGIRFGLEKYSQQAQQNYNAWQAGLERMLLGFAMREENGIWQDSLGFDNSYGLKGQIVGYLSEFIDALYRWQQILQTNHSIEQWELHLFELIDLFFNTQGSDIDAKTQTTLAYLKENIQQLSELLQGIHFQQDISAEVIYTVFAERLQDAPHSLKFLVGKVNFCTLLPMRSIPFKVVCLLGMNESDYPRQQTPNSFDLMQYHRKKGDRFRREDDRYLFLEALTSAQDYLYISYVGRSIIDDSEREPSVLVKQFLDYLVENIEPTADLKKQKELKQALIQQHSMTAFSRENFTKKDRTFAKQWLALANNQIDKELTNFLQPLNEQEVEKMIFLNDLISFIQDPVQYFFEQKLRVFLRSHEDSIAETENFALDNLDLYKIKDELIYFSEQEWDTFFEQLKIKGVMPRGAFAEIYQQQVKNDISALKLSISPYLTQQAQQQLADLTVETKYGKVRLVGNISNLFTNEMSRVTWRVATVKIKDIIQSWLHYLMQATTQDNFAQPLHYGLDKQITFEKIEKEKAYQQLQSYVEAYLQGQSQLLLMPMKSFDKYLGLLRNKDKSWKDEDEIDLSACSTCLLEIALDKQQRYFYVEPDPYWQRIFAQTTLDEEQIMEINQRFVEWFDLMLKLKQ